MPVPLEPLDSIGGQITDPGVGPAPMDSTQVHISDSITETFSDVLNTIGMDMFDEEIDNVIFQTNQFLTDTTFTGSGGPFWWILQMCMALGALFAIVMAAGMTYKMLAKGESFDVLKILRVLGVALVMVWWYPPTNYSASVLSMLAYIPNAIGSYTHDLYEIEYQQVQERFNALTPLIKERDDHMLEQMAEFETVNKNLSNGSGAAIGSVDKEIEGQKDSSKAYLHSLYTSLICMVDKIVIFIALILWKVGWWATIYCQQILLGMLTIFGPIQWAFSLLPKWEGAWAKWIIRYLTVHFYGAMLYFVGFYVLLLFDIVLSVQVENMQVIAGDSFTSYLKDAFFTAGYLMVASIVSLKCLNLVPDLAAWMIPEGDTAFSTRSFGEGVASEAKRSAMSLV